MALYVLNSATSTMDAAREMLRHGQVTILSADDVDPPGVLVLDQTEGRGQRGRSWYSVPGESLCVTYFVIISNTEIRDAGDYSMLAGVAVVRALRKEFCAERVSTGSAGAKEPVYEELVNCPFGLKWPNDIICAGKKIGGILVEVVSHTNGTKIGLIGVGLNVNNRLFPPELTGAATSLVLEGYPSQSVESIASRLLDSLQECIAVHRKSGFEATLSEWRRYDTTAGRRYRIQTEAGPGIGVAEGVDSEGSLIVSIAGSAAGSRIVLRSASSVTEIDAE